ncbi:class I SAM-dependent methyltransferase [Yersinia massiliensis]|uniref:class I SAM-dependent methyltransferase n=1 Tax=Yersinia massiliensis TaxID=419257 RepID=UPI0002D8E174|nr:class I SAM-dependent methyltransferase [Yersinia massiliensis]MCB5306754.1 class I SAM-dependent methyltransferase [Yersinia massiliensis]
MLKQMLKLLKNDKNNQGINNPVSDNISNIEQEIVDKPISDIKDYSLYSGERQTANTVEGIRRDHTSRYELAIDIMLKKEEPILNGADIFCGNGYGTYMLSSNFSNVNFIGIDGSSEAINEANINFTRENNIFSNKLYPFTLPVNTFDIITCFESLEHVDKDGLLFDEIKKSCKSNGLIIVSVPNEEIHSLVLNPHKFHFRHYTHSDFLDKFGTDLELITWYGQNVYKFDESGVNTHQLLNEVDMYPIEHVQGQVNIYVFKKR